MANNSLPSPAAIEGINGAQRGIGGGRGGAGQWRGGASLTGKRLSWASGGEGCQSQVEKQLFGLNQFTSFFYLDQSSKASLLCAVFQF